MNKEEAKALYEGKFFYEIVKTENPLELKLIGPFDNIYFANPNMPKQKTADGQEYEYLQVIDGTPRQAFTKEEILITDRKL